MSKKEEKEEEIMTEIMDFLILMLIGVAIKAFKGVVKEKEIEEVGIMKIEMVVTMGVTNKKNQKDLM